MTEQPAEATPEPAPAPSAADIRLEERGIDIGQAAVDTVGAFLGSGAGAAVGAWLGNKLNPTSPADPPADPVPQVILPPNVDGSE
jgi:hypothetical protein